MGLRELTAWALVGLLSVLGALHIGHDAFLAVERVKREEVRSIRHHLTLAENEMAKLREALPVPGRAICPRVEEGQQAILDAIESLEKVCEHRSYWSTMDGAS